MVPLLLIVVSVLLGIVVAVGDNPQWGQYSHGLAAMILARRLQWLLVVIALALSMALLALVISGRRRVWWLIGLAPILSLFVYRFAFDPMRQFAAAENPLMLDPAHQGASVPAGNLPAEDDEVVGLIHKSTPYAFPLSALYKNPVVIEQDADGRFALLWSCYANCASAATVDHDIKARDLEIVSMPADADLIYSARFGQFINAVTLDLAGAKGDWGKADLPTGFHRRIAVWKMPWRNWRALHPDTRVMSVPPAAPDADRRPLEPIYPLPPSATVVVVGKPEPPNSSISLIATTQPSPLAVLSSRIAPQPINLHVDPARLLIFRDPDSGLTRVFDRHVKDPESGEDMYPIFHRRLAKGMPLPSSAHPPQAIDKHPTALLVDADTASLWTADGKAIEGSLKGAQLRELHEFNCDVYLGVMKACYPELQLIDAQPEPDAPDNMLTGGGSAAPRHTGRHKPAH